MWGEGYCQVWALALPAKETAKLNISLPNFMPSNLCTDFVFYSLRVPVRAVNTELMAARGHCPIPGLLLVAEAAEDHPQGHSAQQTNHYYWHTYSGLVISQLSPTVKI
jgi:hypothetical protein